MDDELPDAREVAALVVLEEDLREDAAETLAYFRSQGVHVRVISGDNPTTVGALAAQVLTGDLGRTALRPWCVDNFHPGSNVGQGLEEGIRQIAAALEGALASAPEACVLLETMAGKGTEIGGRFQELRMILDAVRSPQLHVCLDTCHVWDAGYDIAGSLEGVLEEFDRVIGLSHLRAIHMNDSKNPLGARKDRHACLGAGRIGLEALKRVATHPALHHLPMILETPNELPGYAREIQLLRES